MDLADQLKAEAIEAALTGIGCFVLEQHKPPRFVGHFRGMEMVHSDHADNVVKIEWADARLTAWFHEERRELSKAGLLEEWLRISIDGLTSYEFGDVRLVRLNVTEPSMPRFDVGYRDAPTFLSTPPRRVDIDFSFSHYNVRAVDEHLDAG